MKCKVRLTYEVELVVEGDSEDSILDWLYSTTPSEAMELAKEYSGSYIDEDYTEEILDYLDEDAIVDYVIGEW